MELIDQYNDAIQKVLEDIKKSGYDLGYTDGQLSRQLDVNAALKQFTDLQAEFEAYKAAQAKPGMPRGWWAGSLTPGDTTTPWQTNYDRVKSYLLGPTIYREFPGGYNGKNEGLIPKSWIGSRAESTKVKKVVISFTPTLIDDWLTGTAVNRLVTYLNTVPDDIELWYCPHHEPQPEWSTDQIRQVFTKVAAAVPRKPNLHLTYIAMGFDVASKRWTDSLIVPGVDVLSWDAYLTVNTPTLEKAFPPLQAINKRLGLPFAISETARDPSILLPGMDAAGSELALVKYLKSLTDTQYVTWFESNKTDGNWLMKDYPSAVAEWVKP